MLSENPREPHESRNAPPWVAAEEALRLRSGRGSSSHESRNAYRRARDAKETGAFCGRCGRTIARAEPIVRTRERVARGQVVFTNVCVECAPEHSRDWPECPCEVCGRPVRWLHYPDTLQYRCCSERCSRRRYNRPRDEASARSREKVCEFCGEAFVATRSDAKTCSPKCRQAAYRAKLRRDEAT